jgi:hypothetical protein
MTHPQSTRNDNSSGPGRVMKSIFVTPDFMRKALAKLNYLLIILIICQEYSQSKAIEKE